MAIVNIILVVLSGLGAAFVLGFCVLLLIYFTQDRAAGVGKWVAGLFRFIKSSVHRLVMHSARRQVQRKLNRVIQQASGDRPFLKCKVKLESARTDTTRENFFRERHFVVTVPQDFDRDDVLVDSLYVFVARSLLTRVKRFLSDSQRLAVDLYFTTRLLETMGTNLVQEFVARYVPSDLSSRVGNYLNAFDTLERHALFEDLFIRELSLAGGKLAPETQAAQIWSEADALLDVLLALTRRGLAEEIDMTLERSYIRTGLVLIGKREKLDSPEPWAEYISRALVPRQIDSVYLLSQASRTKKDVVDAVAAGVRDAYIVARRKQRKALLLQQLQEIYLVALESPYMSALSGEENVGVFSEPADPSAVIDIRSNRGRVLGTIKFVTPEGWGFIGFDDPSLKDAWFDEGQIKQRPAVIGSGDRVECRVIRDEHGRYTGADIRVILSGWKATDGREEALGDVAAGDAVGVGATSIATGSDASLQVIDSEPEDLTELGTVVLELVTELTRHRNGGPVPLADFGWRLRKRLPGFDMRKFGHDSLLGLVTVLAASDPQLRVDRFDNGHPFITLAPSAEAESPSDLTR